MKLTSEPLSGKDSLPDDMSSSTTYLRITVVKTVIILCSYFLIGMLCALTGTTYVHLELLLNCDTKTIAIILPLNSVGIVLGSFFSMSNVNRLNCELTFALALAVQSASTTLMVAVPSIYWVFGMALLQGCGQAITSGELQIYLLQLYKNYRLKDPMIQSSHAIWSLGVAIGPLVISPFLVEISHILQLRDASPAIQNLSATVDSLESAIPIISVLNLTAEYLHSSNASSQEVDLSGVAMVRYAYVALGLPLLLPAAGFLLVHLKAGTSLYRPYTDKPDNNKPAVVTSRRKTFDATTFIVLSLVFYYFYVYVEIVPRGFLTTFVVKLLRWSTRHGTLINSTFFGAVCFGRVVGVPMSAWLRPRTVLAVNLAISLCAAVLFLFAERHDVVVWLAAGLLGYGVSTTYGAMQLWMVENVDLGPRLMALVVIVTASGGLTGSPLVGQMFDRLSPMWVVYVVVIAVVVMCAAFGAMIGIERRLRRQRSYSLGKLAAVNGSCIGRNVEELERLSVAVDEKKKTSSNGHDVSPAVSA